VEENNLVASLLEKVKSAQIPDDLKDSVVIRLNQLQTLSESAAFLPELDKMNRYIGWIANLPWNKKSKDILDIKHAEETLNKYHYGLTPLKERVLEYMAVMQLKSKDSQEIARAPILCFVGLVGTGKTTFAYSIAEALGREIARIPFGGMGDPLDLRGQSRMHPEAEPGKIIKSLKAVQTRNPVMLLDEIDRVTDEGRASIMGVLVELLDPRQNQAFVDHYIDYPFDLSEVVFIATANNTTHIATAVLDRLEPIMMPSYSDEEKITIGRDYLLPRALEEAGVSKETITFDQDVWLQLVRPLGYDAGIRTLERTIQGVVRKIALMVVKGKGQHFQITSENVKEFLSQW
jgi:ATP-dependent Lon protease